MIMVYQNLLTLKTICFVTAIGTTEVFPGALPALSDRPGTLGKSPTFPVTGPLLYYFIVMAVRQYRLDSSANESPHE